MNRQLQGIALILFGIMLMILSIIDPWIPVIESISSPVFLIAGIVLGIIGLVFNFKDKKNK